MPETKVLVVGAGLAGLSTSFHLAERGAKVTLIEKDRVGSGSSSRSGAVNTMLMGSRAATIARGVSFDIFEHFDRILDDYNFHQVGCLGLYDQGRLEPWPHCMTCNVRLDRILKYYGGRISSNVSLISRSRTLKRAFSTSVVAGACRTSTYRPWQRR